MEALIALGSNLGERKEQLEGAIKEINQRIGKVVAQSSFWETAPEFPEGVLGAQQGDFLNAVIACESELNARELLKRLLEIEAHFGRVRTEGLRYQARTLDLDLLALGSLVINEPDLILPHPQLHKRSFVLGPLAEIRSEWVHPVLGKRVGEILRRLL